MQLQLNSFYLLRSLATLRHLTISSVVSVFLLGQALGNTAPTAPDRISITAPDGNRLIISWAGSFDIDGVVTGYEIVKNGTALWLGNVTNYSDYSVSNGVTYAYNIIAVDNEGLRSAMSDTVTYRLTTQVTQSSSGGTSVSGGSISVATAASSTSTEASTGVCTDVDGDGWGWDGEKSCMLSDATNTTTSSSSVSTATASSLNICIDEDGDGYGWDGNSTCLIDQAFVSTFCIDPDGDGFGWDGFSTCLINQAPVSTFCIDPDGDGFGWDGTSTCLP